MRVNNDLNGSDVVIKMMALIATIIVTPKVRGMTAAIINADNEYIQISSRRVNSFLERWTNALE